MDNVKTADRATYATALQDVALLKNYLDEDELLQLCDAMCVCTLKPDTDVIVQGDRANNFFVIYSGSCTVSRNSSEDGKVDTFNLFPGQSFGELALLTGEPRAATVKTAEQTTLLVTPCRIFLLKLGDRVRSKRSEWMKIFADVFSSDVTLKAYQQRMLADSIVQLPEQSSISSTYGRGEKVPATQLASSLVIVKQGALQNTAASGGKYPRGYVFDFLQEKVPNVVLESVAEDTVLGVISNVTFTMYAAGYNHAYDVEEAKRLQDDDDDDDDNGDRWIESDEEMDRLITILRAAKRLAVYTKGLPDANFKQLARSMRPVAFVPGELVFSKGEEGSKMYVVSRGEFSCKHDQVVNNKTRWEVVTHRAHRTS